MAEDDAESSLRAKEDDTRADPAPVHRFAENPYPKRSLMACPVDSPWEGKSQRPYNYDNPPFTSFKTARRSTWTWPWPLVDLYDWDPPIHASVRQASSSNMR